jgi:CarD family transcriptional regulator
MPFKVEDYIYYGSGGICRIDDICESPFEGAPRGVTYYVMHTMSEPKQTILNPVHNDRVVMRAVMTKEECDAVLSALPSLKPFEASNAKLLREKYLGAMKSASPTEWGRVLRTYTVRRAAALSRLVRVTDAERTFFENAMRLLGGEIALAHGISQGEAEERIAKMLE